MNTIELSPVILALVPLVMALTSLLKIYITDTRWSPAISLALGVAGAFLFPAQTLAITVVSGLVVGLTASGLYSGTKATFSSLG